MPYIGRAMKRVEDPRLIRGIATYVDDITLPGMLHVAILRSPYAHAKIKGTKTDAARASPGVVGVFTGVDVNDKCGTVPCASPMPDSKIPKHTVLAADRVYFVGHPVADARGGERLHARGAPVPVLGGYQPPPAVRQPGEEVEQRYALPPSSFGAQV